jgi:uracil-DNA glycosylase
MNDLPRSLRDRTEIERRFRMINAPHVAPLNEWVRSLKLRLSEDVIVPWFDPCDGGVEAQILWLLEAPGGKATVERGGSGFISCDNNDASATNTLLTRVEAGVDRRCVVHWNVIPYYLGSSTKIRAWDRGDIASAGPLLGELLALLPRLRVVILGGGAAQAAWRAFGAMDGSILVVDSPHPSATNVNTRPGTREAIVAAWEQAKARVR